MFSVEMNHELSSSSLIVPPIKNYNLHVLDLNQLVKVGSSDTILLIAILLVEDRTIDSKSYLNFIHLMYI